MIGFSGGAIRGTFGIVVDAALLRFMTLQSGVSLRQDCADDLLGECANQLLGRIKNKLRCYGIMLAVSLPIVLRGIELSLATTTIDVWSHRFSTTKGSVSVWIDVRMADDALFEATNKGPLEGPLEGELLMFD